MLFLENSVLFLELEMLQEAFGSQVSEQEY